MINKWSKKKGHGKDPTVKSIFRRMRSPFKQDIQVLRKSNNRIWGFRFRKKREKAFFYKPDQEIMLVKKIVKIVHVFQPYVWFVSSTGVLQVMINKPSRLNDPLNKPSRLNDPRVISRYPHKLVPNLKFFFIVRIFLS